MSIYLEFSGQTMKSLDLSQKIVPGDMFEME